MKQLPTDVDWTYEIKFDGYRALALLHKGQVELLSRNNKPFLKFLSLTEALSRLPVKTAILDGEIVALDDRGIPSFQLLQNHNDEPLAFYAFDLLELNGVDWKERKLVDRRQKLYALLQAASPPVFFSRDLQGDPRKLWDQIKLQKWEGLIAKRPSSHYELGRRSGAWVKIKAIQRQEFVIAGFTEAEGSRARFGAVLVGFYEGKNLMFAARVGTGFNEKLLHSLHERMLKLKTDNCPFVNLPKSSRNQWGGGLSATDMKRCTWIKPSLIGEVAFTEWTSDGGLRHPSFQGLRTDKNASEVVRE